MQNPGQCRLQLELQLRNRASKCRLATTDKARVPSVELHLLSVPSAIPHLAQTTWDEHPGGVWEFLAFWVFYHNLLSLVSGIQSEASGYDGYSAAIKRSLDNH